MADAQAAGLADKKNWRQYEEAMLTWRAVAKLCRVLFPDVVLGAGYVPEELGAEVTERGDILDGEIISPVDAKNALAAACGNDLDMAKSLWGDRGSSGIDRDTLDVLIGEGTGQVAHNQRPFLDPPGGDSDGDTPDNE